MNERPKYEWIEGMVRGMLFPFIRLLEIERRQAEIREAKEDARREREFVEGRMSIVPAPDGALSISDRDPESRRG